MSQTNLKNSPNSSLLKETRQSKGMTLEFVHESTKIPLDALRAIEEGYSTRILTPFYYRGFIKIYATFLGLNVEAVLKEYSVEPPATKPVTNQKPSNAKPAVTAPLLPKGPSFQDQLNKFWKKFWTPATQRNLLRVVAAAIALFVIVKFVGCVANAFKHKAQTKQVAVKNPVKKQQKVIVKKPVPVQVPKEEAKPVVKEEMPVTRPIVAEARRGVTLAAHAPKDNWIQVKVDGKTVFQMTMKKGTVESWEGKNEIELSGKNIGELNLEVNGKDVSPLSSFSRHAKRVLITKDGLSVKK